MIIYKCPLCSKPLSPDGDLLECPEKHYRAPAKKVIQRWNLFDLGAEGVSLTSELGFDIARKFLQDLQDMNIRKFEL